MPAPSLPHPFRDQKPADTFSELFFWLHQIFFVVWFPFLSLDLLQLVNFRGGVEITSLTLAHIDLLIWSKLPLYF